MDKDVDRLYDDMKEALDGIIKMVRQQAAMQQVKDLSQSELLPYLIDPDPFVREAAQKRMKEVV